MHYADIKQYDVANGPGVRISLFVSGCTHHCKGCFNEEAWDFSYGKLFTEKEISWILESLKPDYIAGLTILGGEPFEPVNQQGILPLVEQVKERYPKKSIWCYSGYDFEKDILGRMWDDCPATKPLLEKIDVLVDGKFIEEEKNINLRFKGSANQRIIQVPQSLENGEVILWNPEYTVKEWRE